MQPTTRYKVWELYQIPRIKESLKTKEGRKAFVNLTGFEGYLMCYKQGKYNINFAEGHHEIFSAIQDCQDFIGVIGFRGCGKSSIMEDYAEYCLITDKSKYTVYIGSTDKKSAAAVKNIKSSIEENQLLREDYDIIIDAKDPRSVLYDKWSETKIVIGDRCIESSSRGSKIRGVKFKNSRVTLVVTDDIEDTENTKNDSIRTATRQWFFTELVPAMAPDEVSGGTKIVMIGNLVHKDCLLAHLDNKTLENGNIIKIIKFPLFDELGNINWREMYPTDESVEKQKQKVYLSGEGMGATIWAREYLLKMVDEEDQVIKDSDIHRYPDDWLLKKKVRGGVGIDLAISKSATADFTAIIKGYEIINDDGERRILIAKNNINQRLDFTETISKAKLVKAEMPNNTVFYVEDVGYQKAAIEVMQKNGILVKPMKVSTDKRSRLIAVSPYIKSGMVLFPNNGADDILKQMVGLGIEPHDDALDACVHLIKGMLDRPTIVIAE